ncbi:MAG: VWA domain-containing protein [Desulfobacterales bacterium]|nr:VWA domain-containing protein [Desulfobacterales bacterium]
MKTSTIKPLVLIGVLISLTTVAMAYNRLKSSGIHLPPADTHTVHLSGQLTQDKVLQNSDGTVHLALTLQADEYISDDAVDTPNIDMVMVLDRSGSMKGRKLSDAKQAIRKLAANLTDKDRLALVAYSEGVQTFFNLMPMTTSNHQRLLDLIGGLPASGGTNLSAGLDRGLKLLLKDRNTERPGRVVLVSDGLANRGITGPQALATMATVAQEADFAVSTVGVGTDFNEQLMSLIADSGGGYYYYLENPADFATAFQNELYASQTSVATALELRIPLPQGVSVVGAAGYPVTMQDGYAVFHPGALKSGQTRKLFLTLKVPTNKRDTYTLNGIQLRYSVRGNPHIISLSNAFKIACIADPNAVRASIDKTEWESKVLQDDFNRLREEVAADIKAGKKEKALGRIQQYYHDQDALNATIGSGKVKQNLKTDVSELRSVVTETFAGAPAEVAKKQKSNAKALQFEGYKGRRSYQ